MCETILPVVKMKHSDSFAAHRIHGRCVSVFASCYKKHKQAPGLGFGARETEVVPIQICQTDTAEFFF